MSTAPSACPAPPSVATIVRTLETVTSRPLAPVSPPPAARAPASSSRIVAAAVEAVEAAERTASDEALSLPPGKLQTSPARRCGGAPLPPGVGERVCLRPDQLLVDIDMAARSYSDLKLPALRAAVATVTPPDAVALVPVATPYASIYSSVPDLNAPSAGPITSPPAAVSQVHSPPQVDAYALSLPVAPDVLPTAEEPRPAFEAQPVVASSATVLSEEDVAVACPSASMPLLGEMTVTSTATASDSARKGAQVASIEVGRLSTSALLVEDSSSLDPSAAAGLSSTVAMFGQSAQCREGGSAKVAKRTTGKSISDVVTGVAAPANAFEKLMLAEPELAASALFVAPPDAAESGCSMPMSRATSTSPVAKSVAEVQVSSGAVKVGVSSSPDEAFDVSVSAVIARLSSSDRDQVAANAAARVSPPRASESSALSDSDSTGPAATSALPVPDVVESPSPLPSDSDGFLLFAESLEVSAPTSNSLQTTPTGRDLPGDLCDSVNLENVLPGTPAGMAQVSRTLRLIDISPVTPAAPSALSQFMATPAAHDKVGVDVNGISGEGVLQSATLECDERRRYPSSSVSSTRNRAGSDSSVKTELYPPVESQAPASLPSVVSQGPLGLSSALPTPVSTARGLLPDASLAGANRRLPNRPATLRRASTGIVSPRKYANPLASQESNARETQKEYDGIARRMSAGPTMNACKPLPRGKARVSGRVERSQVATAPRIVRGDSRILEDDSLSAGDKPRMPRRSVSNLHTGPLKESALPPAPRRSSGVTIPKPFTFAGERFHTAAQEEIERKRAESERADLMPRMFRARPMPDFTLDPRANNVR